MYFIPFHSRDKSEIVFNGNIQIVNLTEKVTVAVKYV